MLSRFIKNLVFSTLLLSNAWGEQINTTTTAPIPTPTTAALATPLPPQTDAKSYILLDTTSGKILAEKNPDQRVEPASLTKIMSLYVVYQAIKEGRIKPDDLVYISEKAWKTEGSRMFINPRTQIPVRDLILGTIVVSGNDATIALAEHVAGSEEAFVNLMNQESKALGMTNSHFMDSAGLPNPQHYSTARDMAILARALIKNFPEQYASFKEKWLTYNSIKQPNRNRLLWQDKDVDGIKTGHTNSAGYCLISSALKNNMRLVAVVMGSSSDNTRINDSQKLLAYGFRFFETLPLYQAGKTITEQRVWMGKSPQIAIGAPNDIYVTVPRGQIQQIKPSIEIAEVLKAPITKNQTLGTLRIHLNNTEIATQPLVALTDNPQGGLWTRMKDYFSLTFNGLFGGNNKQNT